MDVPLVLIPHFQLFVFISIADGISDSGYQCSNKCGMMGQIDGKFWCLTLGGRDSWDYCTPTYNGKFSYFRT